MILGLMKLNWIASEANYQLRIEKWVPVCSWIILKAVVQQKVIYV